MLILGCRNAFYPDFVELHRMLSNISIAIYEWKWYVMAYHFRFHFAFT